MGLQRLGAIGMGSGKVSPAMNRAQGLNELEKQVIRFTVTHGMLSGGKVHRIVFGRAERQTSLGVHKARAYPNRCRFAVRSITTSL